MTYVGRKDSALSFHGYCQSFVRFQDLPEDRGIQTHSWLTALFLRCFNRIVDVQFDDGRIVHLNKNSFESWKEKHQVQHYPALSAINRVCATALEAQARQLQSEGKLA